MNTTNSRLDLEQGTLLERDEELAVLDRCWSRVSDTGSGQLVLVTGEAGAGKTSLLRRFWSGLDASVRVLWAACDALATPRPLGPLLDVARAVEGSLRETLDAQAQPYDVADALLEELDPYGRPTVLVIEDLHWADDATLDVVRILARRLPSIEGLLLFTFREEELSRFSPLRSLLGDLGGTSGINRLDIAPLSAAGVAQLAAGSGIDADELHARTGGNPFFVSEAIAAGSEGLPRSVSDAVLSRAGRLGPTPRRLLDTVAIVPAGVEAWLLAALADDPEADLEACVASGMLRFSPTGVEFRHELARQAIEGSIAPDRRLNLHRKALKALSAPPNGRADVTRLAYHAEAAADTAAVLDFAPRAARLAASVGAHSEAQAQYGRALRFADGLDPRERADLLESFAQESYLTDMRLGAIEAAGEAVAIYAAADDPVGQGRCLNKRAQLHACAGNATPVRADLEAAVSVLAPCPTSTELAIACGALAISLIEDSAELALETAQRGVEIAERAGDRAALSKVLNNQGITQLLVGDPAGEQQLRRSLELALESDDGPQAGVGYINLVFGLGLSHRWNAADLYIEEGISYCSRRGLDAWEQCLLAYRAESELCKGSWDKVPGTAAAVFAGSPDWHVEPRFSAAVNLGLLRARRGDPGAWALLDEASAMACRTAEALVIGQAACARAEARWLEGDFAGVAAEADAFVPAGVDSELHVGALAVWRRRAGLPWEEPNRADSAHRLELAGDPGAAASEWVKHGCPYDSALAVLTDGNVSQLREAHETLTSLGARPAAAVAARRLREAGERGVPRGPRARTRENSFGLTARQLEVLGLMAEGKRNGEIAERLVLSPKTVDHHVSAILGKLDARTRGEASAKAMASGLLASAAGEPDA